MNNQNNDQISQQVTPSNDYETRNPKISTDDLEKQVKSLNKDLKQINDKTENLKKDFLIFLGIFVSFITYISIEIKILQTATDIFMLIGLSSFFLSAVLLFAFTLSNIVKDKDTVRDYFTPTFFILVIFLMISFYCFHKHFQM